MIIIIPFFDFFGNERFVENHYAAQKKLNESGCKCFTYEAILKTQQAPRIEAIEDNMHMHVVVKDVMWHKERMINLAVKHLDDIGYKDDDVMWIDSGCYINKTAIKKVKSALNEVPFVQPFSNVCYQDQLGEGWEREVPSAAYQRRMNSDKHGAPGGAWAMRREFFQSACEGLYDRLIVGSADQVFSDSILLGKPRAQLLPDGLARDNVNDWHRKLQSDYPTTPWKVIGTNLIHLWHMHTENRKVHERMDAVLHANFDPAKWLDTDKNGMYYWTKIAKGTPKGRRFVRYCDQYLAGRHKPVVVKEIVVPEEPVLHQAKRSNSGLHLWS